MSKHSIYPSIVNDHKHQFSHFNHQAATRDIKGSPGKYWDLARWGAPAHEFEGRLRQCAAIWLLWYLYHHTGFELQWSTSCHSLWRKVPFCSALLEGQPTAFVEERRKWLRCRCRRLCKVYIGGVELFEERSFPERVTLFSLATCRGGQMSAGGHTHFGSFINRCWAVCVLIEPHVSKIPIG